MDEETRSLIGLLERARGAYDRRAWEDAYVLLAQADARTPLAVDDLERLAWCAALRANDREFIACLERLHDMHIAAGRSRAAGRAAFWADMRYFSLGESAHAGGWLARCQRLVAEEAECPEQGFLLLPATQRCLGRGDFEAARETARRAAAIGQRTDTADLVAFGRCLEGRAAIRMHRVEEGLTLLDEAMIAASGQAVSPLVAGLVYCSVIAGCQQVYALERCREWTELLKRWCDAQPQLGIFTGICMAHRAEVMELQGEWNEASLEAEQATVRLARSPDPEAKAAAHYRRAELFRLRGDFVNAEEAYKAAAAFGMEPQPGLALLRLGEGNAASATAQIARVLAGTSDPLRRARFLPAAVEIHLAAGDVASAGAATAELSEIAESLDIEALRAMSLHATGALLLAGGKAG